MDIVALLHPMKGTCVGFIALILTLMMCYHGHGQAYALALDHNELPFITHTTKVQEASHYNLDKDMSLWGSSRDTNEDNSSTNNVNDPLIGTTTTLGGRVGAYRNILEAGLHYSRRLPFNKKHPSHKTLPKIWNGIKRGGRRIRPSPKRFNKQRPPIYVSIKQEITSSWYVKGVKYYRYKVTVKNVSTKRIKQVKLKIKGLRGPIWGVSRVGTTNIYNFPSWLDLLHPSHTIDFVYVQTGFPALVYLSTFSTEM